MRRTLLCAFILLLGGNAYAAQIKVFPLADPDWVIIAVVGDLELGDEKTFVQQALSYENAIVDFDSPGGNLVAGIEIGKAIRLKGFSTGVDSNGVCASACALAWLGGAKRALISGGRVGFHAAYVENNGQNTENGLGNALAGAYLNQLGLPQSAIAFITSASPDSMTWLTAETVKSARSIGIEFTVLGPDQPTTSDNGRENGNSSLDGNSGQPDYARSGFKRLVDADIFGYDLDGMPLNGMTVETCEVACSKNSSCQAYTYNQRNSGCFLKSSGGRVLGHPLAVTGYKVEIEAKLTRSPITIYERTDLPGGNYRQHAGLSFGDCVSVCEKDHRCVAFSYIHRYQQCQLKWTLLQSIDQRISISGIKVRKQ
jgi:PAN domain